MTIGFDLIICSWHSPKKTNFPALDGMDMKLILLRHQATKMFITSALADSGVSPWWDYSLIRSSFFVSAQTEVAFSHNLHTNVTWANFESVMSYNRNPRKLQLSVTFLASEPERRSYRRLPWWHVTKQLPLLPFTCPLSLQKLSAQRSAVSVIFLFFQNRWWLHHRHSSASLQTRITRIQKIK